MIDKFLALLDVSKENRPKFSKTKKLTCHCAYMKTKYGKDYTNETVLKNFYKETDDLIESKIRSGVYCAVVEIDEDILRYKDLIIKEYTGPQRGFGVVIIDNEVMNKIGIGKFDKTSTYMVISWKNPEGLDIIDDEQPE